MRGGRPEVLAPPEGLRPAQLGVVLLGRVIFGHVSATLVDLAGRGFLGIDEAAGDSTSPDWLLTDMRGQAAGEPLSFEAALLDGLFAQHPVVHVSQIGDGLVPVLNRFRARLQSDAVQGGWLRRWHRGQRTPGGEQLLQQILSFRRELRALAAAGDATALAGYAPYAMIFGLRPSPVRVTDTVGTGAAGDRGTGVPWPQSDRFAQGWLDACAGFFTNPGRWHKFGISHSSDFVTQWSAPHDHHDHRSHGHDSGHVGHSGGDGHYEGGHHGSFDTGHGGF